MRTPADHDIAVATPLDSATVLLRFVEDRANLTWRDILDRWESDDAFCAAFTNALIEAPMPAYFWETAALTRDSADQPFECVLKHASELTRLRADASPFAVQLAAAQGDVIAFGNLGGDADLVVPRDRGEGVDYAHLASFLRTAQPDQVRALWRHIALSARPWLARQQTCWISTSGLGVSWLHVRLDARPKYYSHAPYRNA